jgi:hypothetical protein
MSNEATPSRWFSGWRMRETPVIDDPADMGTAFGLDMSFNEASHESKSAAPGADEQPGWVQRLTGRPKSTR